METLPSLSGKEVPPKPIAGLIVILFVATVIGGWLYVDAVRHELEARIEALETRRPVAVVQESGGRMMAPTAENGWHRVVSTKHAYALQLPPGYHFLDEDEMGYVLPDPNDEDDNPLPVMTVTITPAAAKETRSGKMIQMGSTAYWFSLWEGLEWEPYEQVVESFQAL